MPYGITPGHDYKLPLSDNITTADNIAKKSSIYGDSSDIWWLREYHNTSFTGGADYTITCDIT